MWFVRWWDRSDGCDGNDGDAMEGIVFSAFCFFPVSFPVFLSRFSTFRSKVLMKGGGYVTGG
jgi:hypothetical protein